MREEEIKKALEEKFSELYGNTEGIRYFFAPGRVNLIGEHTDYNGGHVFPCALSMGSYAAVKKREDKNFRFYSLNVEGAGVISAGEHDFTPLEDKQWAAYLKGVIWAMEKRGLEIPCGLDLVLYGNIPNGSGLSSSASLEVLMGSICKELYGLSVSFPELALIGQYSENNYNGMNCGIMDQFASVFGKAGKLLRLDCKSFEYEEHPFDPKGYRLLLVDSCVKHELASSAYNKRRESCENVVAALAKRYPEIKFLRDASFAQLEEVKNEVSEEDYKRAAYVIGEVERVLAVCEALDKGDYQTVGEKMYETHHGMSKLYEVSCEELDFLNDLAREFGVTGSRVMGGGFGGCTINLLKEELHDSFIAEVKKRYEAKYGIQPKFYDVVISDGARRL